MRIKVLYREGVPIRYRPGTTDEQVIREILDNKTGGAYRKVSVGFEVLPNEKWLDLGAHIGTFAVYCKIRGASTECYEPDPGCFSLLKRNAPWSQCHNSAVTGLKEKKIPFWISSRKGNFSRGTTVPSKRGHLSKTGEVANTFIGDLCHKRYDGVKMDIEGGEFSIFDSGVLPDCQKLCFEYHLSRDASVENLKRRLEVVQSMFRVVSYVAGLDRFMQGVDKSTSAPYDRQIYCVGRKGKRPRPVRV